MLADYVPSPSPRHRRDPHSLQKLADQIVKDVSSARPVWTKWVGKGKPSLGPPPISECAATSPKGNLSQLHRSMGPAVGGSYPNLSFRRQPRYASCLSRRGIHAQDIYRVFCRSWPDP
ncbi:MAG: hypothetical protein EOP17_00580 [Rhizobiaceae bacterium]|nr:MAG: hypothetical protein EOP17_00580 [Rhizobiaceae bacterium]